MGDSVSHVTAEGDRLEDTQVQTHDNWSRGQGTDKMQDYINDSFNAKQQSSKLQVISNVLIKSFPSLSIHLTVSKDCIPFIHVWKPIKKGNGNQGMPFLPCFHIIVTLTSPCEDSNAISREHALFQLHSFHGMVWLFNYHINVGCNCF